MGEHASDCRVKEGKKCTCGMAEVDQIVELLNKIVLDQFKRGYKKGLESSKEAAMQYLDSVMKEIGQGKALEKIKEDLRNISSEKILH